MEQPKFQTVITFGSGHLSDFNVEKDGWTVIVCTLAEPEARQLMFNTPGIGFAFCTSYPYERFQELTSSREIWHYYTYEEVMLRRIVKED